MTRAKNLAVILLLMASAAAAGPPAARVGDPGQPGFHMGSAIVSGSVDVRVNGLPAAIAGSSTSCPQQCVVQVFPPVIIPHSPGNIMNGSATVQINGVPAARVNDPFVEPGTPSVCQPFHSISAGSPNVFIGP